MGTVNLTAPQSYAQQLAQAEYQQKIAQMLQEQANAPIDIQSYKGIQAPIPTTAILAKALQGFGGAYMARQGQKGVVDANETARRDAENYFNPLPLPETPPPGANLAAQLNRTAPTDSPPVPPTDLNAAPTNQPPTVNQAPSALPMPTDLGTAPTDQPSAPPMPLPPPTNLGAAPTNPPPSAPPMPLPPAPPRPRPTTDESISALRDRMTLVLNGVNSPNPYISQRAKIELPMLQQSVQHAQDKVDTAANEQQKLVAAAAVKTLDKQQDQKLAQDMVNNLGSSLSPDQKKMLNQAALGGTNAVQPLIQKMFDDGFTAHFRDATPDELKGRAEGTVGQVNAKTGELVHTFDPTSGIVSMGQLKVNQQRLQIDKDREARMASAGLNEQQQTALDTAVADRRIDPTRLNSRNSKIQADILLHNPGANFVNSHAIAVMTANPAFQSKALIAGAMPEVLQNVRDAGKKLNFSTVSYLGKLQAFKNKTLNDPDFVEYMNNRADAMQTVSNVMRATGATDQSIKMETEAAPITMSPEAFDGWYAGQMKSLAPRISRMTPLTIQSSRAAPTPPPATGGQRVGTYDKQTGKVIYAN